MNKDVCIVNYIKHKQMNFLLGLAIGTTIVAIIFFAMSEMIDRYNTAETTNVMGVLFTVLSIGIWIATAVKAFHV